MPIKGLPGGDFSGCVNAMRGKVDNPRAFCAWKTHELTGKWPAEEAIAAVLDEAPLEDAEFFDYQYNGVKCRATRRRSSTRDNKAWMRRVKFEDDSVLVHYADPDMPMRRSDPQARKDFLARHDCESKRNPRTPGFWSCYDWANPDEGREATMEAHAIHETASGQLHIREAQQGEPFVLMDGVVFEFGVSENKNRYGESCVESAIREFSGKPIRINHPSRSEDRDRPEGDVFVQVGRLPDSSKDNFYVGETRNGRGLLFKGARLSTSAPDIWISDRIRAGIIGDMSINAAGEGVREADGIFTVERFTDATSLDLVTTAAAGGTAQVREAASNTEDIDMNRDEVLELVREAVAEELKESRPALTKEERALLEGYAAQREQAGEEEEPVEEQAMTAELPDELQAVWDAAYGECEAKDGENCEAYAWLSVVAKLLPAGEEEPEQMEAEGEEEDATEAEDEEEMTESDQIRAHYNALVKLGAINPGQVTGMGTKPPKPPKREAASDLDKHFSEAILRSTGDKRLAECAAKGRLL